MVNVKGQLVELKTIRDFMISGIVFALGLKGTDEQLTSIFLPIGAVFANVQDG